MASRFFSLISLFFLVLSSPDLRGRVLMCYHWHELADIVFRNSSVLYRTIADSFTWSMMFLQTKPDSVASPTSLNGSHESSALLFPLFISKLPCIMKRLEGWNIILCLKKINKKNLMESKVTVLCKVCHALGACELEYCGRCECLGRGWTVCVHVGVFSCLCVCMFLSVCQLGLMWLPRETWGRPI